MKPYKIEEGIPYFYLRDVEIYGCPSYQGFDVFRVIDADPIYMSYNFDENPGYSFKPNRVPHLYDRRHRFVIIVSQVLGYKLSIAKSVLRSEKWSMVTKQISDIEDNYWMECRTILKKNGYAQYYNCIPSIIREYCYFKDPVKYTSKDFDLIMMTFQYIQKAFEINNCGRTYFPNLRFILLKIMEFHKIPLQYKIPLLITKSKMKLLNDIFAILVEDIRSASINPPIVESRIHDPEKTRRKSFQSVGDLFHHQ